MREANAVADHRGKGDVCSLILSTLEKAGKPLNALTVEDLAPVDHFHTRGFAATVDLGDKLPVKPHDRLLDIGSGVGGPARYFAARFGCNVTGIDITPAFVEAATKLTSLLKMEGNVSFELGDGQHLPYPDKSFDGAYTQHVTMNVADRPAFFGEAYRVLKPGAFFALTEFGLGARGDPYFPVPWSMDGCSSYLATPAETRALLEAAGFEDVRIEDTGQKYLEAYRHVMELASQGNLPPPGLHILLVKTAPEKTRNAARNIEEGRTHPVQAVCRKP